MKFLSTLFIACLFSLYGNAQTQIASVEKPTIDLSKDNASLSKNAAMLKILDQSLLPEKIIKLHQKIARFNIEDLGNYDKSDPSTYNVTFSETNINVQTLYNQNGKLLEFKGKYKDLRLPYKLSSNILKNYPGWGIQKTYGIYTFTEGDFEMSYKVVINKNGKSKVLKYDASDYGI